MRNVLMATLCLLFLRCVSIPTSKDANVSYSTEVSAWPTSPTCLNPPVPTQFAKEVLIGSRREVVIAGGANPIPDDKWASYQPSLGNRKNSDRHLLFSTSCFSRSPGRPASCITDDCRDEIELDGYTWVGLSKIYAADCLPSAKACDGTSAKPGGLLFVIIEKCHELIFTGDVIFLSGPNGEKAIMHATSNGVPTTNVVLPDGWTLNRETLAVPLTVHPFGGGDRCFYNIIRDSKLQSYHQITYSGPSYP